MARARRALGAACVALLVTAGPAAGSRSQFGRWTFDRFGLPAFATASTSAPTRWRASRSCRAATAAQHQVGNDHIVAAAFNHGYTQLWSQERLPQWANRYDAADRHYAGGFGWLHVGGRTLSTLYLDRPGAGGVERVFGVGYVPAPGARARLRGGPGRLRAVRRRPAARSTTSTIRNASRSDQAGLVVRVLGRQPVRPASTAARSRSANRAGRRRRRTLSASRSCAGDGDNRPADRLRGGAARPGRRARDLGRRLLRRRARARVPAAVAADRLGGRRVDASGHAADALFALRAPVRLRPGRAVRLRYVYGHGARPTRSAPLVDASIAPAARPGRGVSARRWARWLPKADFGAAARWVARELAVGRLPAALRLGLRGGAAATTRSPRAATTSTTPAQNLGYAQLAALRAADRLHASPSWRARSCATRSSSQSRDPTADAARPTAPARCARRFDLGSSNDLDFWLLLAAGEYGLGTRDPRSSTSRCRTTTRGSRRARGEHIKLAFRAPGDAARPARRLLMAGDRRLVGLLHRAPADDRVDCSCTAQLAYAYPRLAELADAARRPRVRRDAARAAAPSCATIVARQWTGRGWYARGCSGDRTRSAPARSSGSRSRGRSSPARRRRAGAKRLVANIRRFLTAIGAPPAGRPKIGTAHVARAARPRRDGAARTAAGPALGERRRPLPARRSGPAASGST